MNLRLLSVAELLALHGAVLEELHARGTVRTANGPAADYAELLCCSAFGWTREPNSKAGYDATDADGRRYQIKARRANARNGSRQLGALRGLEDDPFDHLAGLLFTSDFQVARAAMVPRRTVHDRASYVARTNSWKFFLTDDVWTLPGVRDVTAELRAAQALIG